MKKIFKGLAVLAATAVVGTGLAFAGCDPETPGNSGNNPGGNNGGNDPAKVAVYTLVSKKGDDIINLDDYDATGYRPNAFTVRIAADEDGKILAYVIDENGSTADRYTNAMPESFRDGSWFVGKTVADMVTAVGEDLKFTSLKALFAADAEDALTAGATQSSFTCVQLAAFASANADDVIGGAALSTLTEYAGAIDLAESSVVVVDEDDYVAPEPIPQEKVAIYTLVSKKGDDIINLDDYDSTGYRPNAFTVRIAADKDGKILAYVLDENGSTADRYASAMPESFRDGSWFVGKTVADMVTAVGADLKFTSLKALFAADAEDALTAGATQSCFTCVQLAAFASKNAAAVIDGTALSTLTEYAGAIDLAASSVEVVDEDDYVAPQPIVKAKVVNYTLVSKTGSDIVNLDDYTATSYRPNAFTVKISVDEDGKILSFVIETNGSTGDTYVQRMPESFRDGSWFVGKTVADMVTAVGGDLKFSSLNTLFAADAEDALTAGATQSCFTCVQLAAFAAANAQAVLGGAALSSLTEYAGAINLESSTVEVVDAE